MEKQTKESAYNRLFKAIKSHQDLSNINQPKTDHYEFSCTICGGITMEFLLRGDADLLIIKAEVKVEDGKNEQEIFELGSEIVENTTVRFTSYENKIIFQSVLPLAGDSGLDAEKKIFNETLSFVQLMIQYKDKLGCKESSKSNLDMDFTENENDDDPFGFNSFDDSKQTEEQNNMFNNEADNLFGGFDNSNDILFEEQPKPQQPITLDIFKQNELQQPDDIFNPLNGFDNNELNFDEPMIQTEPIQPVQVQPQPITLNIEKEDEPIIEQLQKIEEVEEVEEIVDDGLDDMLANLNTTKIQRTESRAERRQRERNKQKVLDEEKTSENIKPSKELNNRNKENHNVINKAKNSNINSIKLDEDPTDIFDNMGVFENQNEIVDEEIIVAPIQTQQSRNHKKKNKPKKTPSNIETQNNNEENNTMSTNYERAPEVIEQMKHLYAEVDQMFAQRKKQADYREQTLDDFSNRLDKREKELAVRASRIEQNFKDTQIEISKSKENFATQKQEIDFQWNKIKMEKDTIEMQKKNLAEKEAILEKTAALNDQSEELGSQNDELNIQIKELQSEIETQKTKISDLTRSYEEKIETLNELLNVSSQSMSDSEEDKLKDEIRVLKTKLQDMEDDIEDLNADIADMTDESVQKDKIIQSFTDRQNSWKKKEADYKAKLAANKSVVATPIVDDTSIKELEGKLNDALSQVTDAKKKTAEANQRIAQLQSENERIKNTAANKNDDSNEEIKRLNFELQQAKSDLSKADAAYEEEKKAKEQAISEHAVAKDTKQIASDIKSSLSEIGIDVNPVAGAGELVLNGYSEECQVIINVDAGILYIEKPVRKGIKYKPDVEKWNQEDIRTSYMFSDKKVICKTVYDDISKSAMAIIGRLQALS